MRLVFYCPLTARIGHDLKEMIRLKSYGAYRKYHYFIPHFFNNSEREVAVFWDPALSRLANQSIAYGYLKCLLWMIVNKINPLKTKVLVSIEKLDPERDVLIVFPFLSCDRRLLTEESTLAKYPGLKIFHFTHYFFEPSKICSIISSYRNTLIIGDGDLARNPLYQKYMGQRTCYPLPFALRPRYQSLTLFEKRKSKCLACGTKSKVCPPFYAEFLEVFNAVYLHKLRGEIYDKKHEINQYIDSYIYDYYELDDYLPNTLMEKIKHKIRRKIGHDRKRFFSFDIVKKYNEYQMFVSPEEESGAPSISFIEGMACGCAYFGRPEFYDCFGMKPEVHFIPYNGTLDDLIEQIQIYQKHPELLKTIANTGRQYVLDYFQSSKIANEFYAFLKRELYANSSR